MHHYYHTEGRTDLSKIRDQANERAAGTGIFDRWPESSWVHLHPKAVLVEGTKEPIEFQCLGGKHEYYRMVKLNLSSFQKAIISMNGRTLMMYDLPELVELPPEPKSYIREWRVVPPDVNWRICRTPSTGA